ncbi:MAG: hypothetical protein KIY11_09805, partial [Thermoplasmata archaeon]|nr:hypothetical protein [Candidatus Sysuiplasma acidicola]
MNDDRNEEAISFWKWVISETYEKRQLNLGKQFVNGESIPRPEKTTGMLVRHIGEPKGQIADWRASFADSDEGFHAVEFADRYYCHIDKKDPLKKPLEHLVEDSPQTLELL